MRLKKLQIEMQQWGELQGKYLGEVVFEGGNGQIQLTMLPEICEKIFEVVQSQLIESSKALASNMTNVITDRVKPQLERSQETAE